MKRLIAFISILMLVSLASGTATSITIYGTNRSNSNSNITCGGCNNSIYVNAWNTSYVKNITVNSSNASGDVISFNISNVTAYQVQELKVNKTAVNAYQAGANGMLNFSYNVTGNKTLTLSPASNMNGYNFTWAYTWNAIGGSAASLTMHNSTAACVKDTVYQNTNKTPIVFFLSVRPDWNGAAAFDFFVSPNNPPTDILITNLTNTGIAEITIPLTIEVPSNYYYKFEGNTAFDIIRQCAVFKR